MLQVNNISIQFGGKALFQPCSFSVNEKERIGLVGKNGAGKSTLLKILTGEVNATEGSVNQPKEYTKGYLKQDLPPENKNSVWDEVMQAFEELQKIEKKVADLQHEMENRTDYDSEAYYELIEEYTKAHDRLDRYEGENIDKKIETVLMGLGFKREDFEKSVDTFSGGWRMRIELAKLLLQQPDLLLLDEPTNHLDIHSIIWLEQFLLTYPGAIILVSHDRSFMRSIVNRIIEIELGKVSDYKAGYDKYLELKKDRIEKSISAHKNQQKEIEQIKRNIEKFRAKASKAKFAQSLIKQLDKTEIIEVEQEETSSMRFRFPEGKRAGKSVVKLSHIRHAFGDKVVLKDANFELLKGEKVAFVGKNGMGKTTMARIISGELKPTSGQIEFSQNTELSYFAQLQSGTLEESLTVFETIDNVATGDMRTQVRNLLGAFLFSGDDADKKVKVLSGGEKSRLALAKLLLKPSNFLLLDEPTNHLDLSSKKILKEAIQKYQEACIIVSHDRDFLEGLTDRVIEFTEEGLVEYLGDINYFLDKRKVEDFKQLELSGNNKTKQENKPIEKAVVEEKPKVDKQLKNKIQKLEKEIEETEQQLKELEQKLQTQYNDKTATEYHALEQKLEKLTEEWVSLEE
jgi:ATP-binding cassette, subfamily F, member 3